MYLCGSVENESDVWDLFDGVVCLVVRDDAILRDRLLTRTTNEFGKAPEVLAAILSWSQSSEDSYRKLGATIVDAAQPLARVVDDVLAAGRVHLMARAR